LFAVVAGLLVLPIESSISRRFEARADAIAVRLTDDSDTAVRVFRRLAFSNIADLRPPPVAVWALFSHPPITERIKAVLGQGRPGAG
jgi:STE24 endopeptidase